MIFYMIFCTQGELISFPWAKSPSEHCFGLNFDVTDTNQIESGIVPFIFMTYLISNSIIENAKVFALESEMQISYSTD